MSHARVWENSEDEPSSEDSDSEGGLYKPHFRIYRHKRSTYPNDKKKLPFLLDLNKSHEENVGYLKKAAEPVKNNKNKKLNENRNNRWDRSVIKTPESMEELDEQIDTVYESLPLASAEQKYDVQIHQNGNKKEEKKSSSSERASLRSCLSSLLNSAVSLFTNPWFIVAALATIFGLIAWIAIQAPIAVPVGMVFGGGGVTACHCSFYRHKPEKQITETFSPSLRSNFSPSPLQT